MEISNPNDVDMSPEGIDRRMRSLRRLYKLWLEVKEARLLGKSEDLRRQASERATDASSSTRSFKEV